MEIPKGKSSGPDGFTIDFFQACCWSLNMMYGILWKTLTNFPMYYHTLDATFIALIPKEYKVEDPNKFKSISL
jgi:hypothetical protein